MAYTQNSTSAVPSLTSSTEQQKPKGQEYTIRVFTTTVLVFMIVMIIFGNTLVLVTTWLDKRLHQPNKYFIACLAVADLFVGVFSAPIRLYLHVHPSELVKIEICRFWNWIDFSCEVASIVTLATISVDRYIKISMPFKYRSLMTTSRSIILICFISLISIIHATLALFPYGGSHGILARAGYGCLYDNPIYMTVTASVFFFGPLVIIIAMYAQIFHIAHQRKKLARNGAFGQSLASRKKAFTRQLFQELKTVRMLLLVILTFVVCWGPFFTIYLLNIYKSHYVFKSLTKNEWNIVSMVFVQVLPSFNSLCNPVIYACFDREYSKAFKSLFQRMFCCTKDRRSSVRLSKSFSTQSFRLKERQSRRTSNLHGATEAHETSPAETALL